MKLSKKIAFLSILAIALISINTNCFARTVTVNTDTLKLRKEPSTDSATLELLSKGDELEYIEETGNWCKVKVKEITGYVSKDYVVIEKEEETNEITINTSTTPAENTTSNNATTNNTTTNNAITNNTTTSTVNEYTATEMKLLQNANAYILPLINSDKIYEFPKDTTVMVVAETNGWAYVQTDEVNAWIRKDKLENTTANNVDNTTAKEQADTNSNTDINTNTTTDDGDNDENNNDNNTISNTVDTNTTNNDDTGETTYSSRKTMYVKETSVYVRSGPGTNYKVVETMIYNNKVYVTGESADWYSVEVNGVSGYIAKWLLSDTEQPDSTSRGGITREEGIIASSSENTNSSLESTTTSSSNSSKGEQIVAYAKQYLGCPYVYGGSGPSTFDCSGFTMYVYKNFGVSLSHSATAQSKNGTYVAKENLQPGDLVFFKDYETMDGIGHCGIYVGDGNFIHASSGTGYCVKISTLLSGSYLNRYDTARRII